MNLKNTHTLNDPTYDRTAIDENPVWQLAFSLSEIQNDNAPIGWSKYIYTAKCLLSYYEIKAWWCGRPQCFVVYREDARQIEHKLNQAEAELIETRAGLKWLIEAIRKDVEESGISLQLNDCPPIVKEMFGEGK